VRQIGDSIRPAGDAEFVALDRVWRLLASAQTGVRAIALVNWCKTLADWARREDEHNLKRLKFQEAIARATAVLDMPDATSEQKVVALVNRGVTKGKAGDTQGELADYNTILSMPDATGEQKAQAIFNRGVAKRQAGDAKGELADYNAVLGMPDATTERKVTPLANRGVATGGLGFMMYLSGDYAGAVAASQQALALKPDMDWVHANLGLALLRLGRTEEGLQHYREAIPAITQPADLDNIVVADLRDAMKAVGSLPGAEAVLEMVERRKRELAGGSGHKPESP